MRDFIGMDDIWDRLFRQDEMGCLGDFNPNSRLCTRKCALAVRCIIVYNHRIETMEVDDLFGFQDSDIAPIQ